MAGRKAAGNGERPDRRRRGAEGVSRGLESSLTRNSRRSGGAASKILPRITRTFLGIKRHSPPCTTARRGAASSRKFRAATESDAAGEAFHLFSSENHPGLTVSGGFARHGRFLGACRRPLLSRPHDRAWV